MFDRAPLGTTFLDATLGKDAGFGEHAEERIMGETELMLVLGSTS